LYLVVAASDLDDNGILSDVDMVGMSILVAGPESESGKKKTLKKNVVKLQSPYFDVRPMLEAILRDRSEITVRQLIIRIFGQRGKGY
jgi:hypothetical protein